MVDRLPKFGFSRTQSSLNFSLIVRGEEPDQDIQKVYNLPGVMLIFTRATLDTTPRKEVVQRILNIQRR